MPRRRLGRAFRRLWLSAFQPLLSNGLKTCPRQNAGSRLSTSTLARTQSTMRGNGIATAVSAGRPSTVTCGVVRPRMIRITLVMYDSRVCGPLSGPGRADDGSTISNLSARVNPHRATNAIPFSLCFPIPPRSLFPSHPPEASPLSPRLSPASPAFRMVLRSQKIYISEETKCERGSKRGNFARKARNWRRFGGT